MTFRAYVVTRQDDQLATAVGDVEESELHAGGLVVDVTWSAVNYKDAMVTEPGNRVARRSPLVPGVDLAGTVVESDDPEFPPGTGGAGPRL